MLGLEWASRDRKQVASVCRVLLSKPRLVLMDESTSALDTGNEAALYAALGEVASPMSASATARPW